MARPKGIVSDPHARRANLNLAALLRERFHEDLLFEWQMLILSGQAPRIVKDARCTHTGGYRCEADPDDKMATSSERRDKAMQDLLNRRDGLPMQRVALEADLRGQGQKGGFDGSALSNMDPAKLGKLIGAIKNALSASSPKPLAELEEAEEQREEGEVELVPSAPDDALQR